MKRALQLFALSLGCCFAAGPVCASKPPAGAENLTAARLNNLGVALMNQQLTGKALAAFQQAEQADPASGRIATNEGIALLYLQKVPEAQAALGRAVKLAPGDPAGWYVSGLLERMLGHSEAAMEDFERVLALNPDDADAHYLLGSTYFGMQKYPQSLAEFQAALKLNPVHASALFGLSRALQRLGRTQESQAALEHFSEMQRDKIASPMTSDYGGQGHYAMAEDLLLPEEPVTPMIPVTFAPWPVHTGPWAQAEPVADGGGLCMLRRAKDGGQDLVALGSGPEAIHVLHNTGQSFEALSAEQTGLTATGEAVACAVGDYDNDGLPDLAVAMRDRVLLFHNLGDGRFADVTTATGIRQLNHPAGLTFIDFDHDGDLDLFLPGAADTPGGSPNVLWRNDGNGHFTEWTGPTALGGEGQTVNALLSDVNNDRAVDLLVTGSRGAPTFYANQREGPFKAAALYREPGLAPSAGITALDFNKDGWMDYAVTHDGAPGLSLWRNMDGVHFERVALPVKGVKRAWGVTPIDIDNDGWIDLAAVVETDRGTELRVFRNRGPEGFEDVSDRLGLSGLVFKQARSVVAADVNGDGAADLIVSELDGAPVVLRNVGGSRNHSLRLDLTGLADNKSAIGTKVEVLVNGHQQKFEIAGGSGYLGQGSLEVLAGLGQAMHADVVRLLWPTGVPQDEIDEAANAPVTLKELDRRGSSCPVLFAWDGKQYRFVSDVIGAAVVGHWISPARTNRNDADEWIKVDGEDLKPSHGLLSLRFGEPMEEINYIDRLRLVAVDHPEGTVVYPDEKFLDNPPFASGAAVTASHPHPVAGAWDDHGRDVNATLRTTDHQYVRDFTNLPFAGFANRHTLTLDLGAWDAHKPLRLLMRGYIEYFSASSMYAAWQAGLKPESPSVEALMPDGRWRKVIADMGFPAGLPRTVVVDLTGKLPPNVQRIRISTNLQIYWDQVLVSNDLPVPVHQTELPLAMAHLAFRGYPKQVEGATPGDLTYDYSQISATGPFAWQRGSYTHFGNVTPLLQGTDNQYVIFGSGEEIDAEFRAAAAPPLPLHWKRDYFFYANGFVKDMDFYEALPFTVAQLPYQGMPSYPYPAQTHYPETPDTLRYRLDWNDRFESGERIQPWRFDYQPTVSTPADRP